MIHPEGVTIGNSSADAAEPTVAQARERRTPWLERVEELAAAPHTPLLLVGAGGAGAAKRLHRATHRGKLAPFVHVDCSWLPEGDAARALFGVESASKVERGFVERANGGTLFLDHAERLPLAEQARLSTLFDTMRIRRIDGREELPVSVRVVACVSSNEDAMLAEGRLHPDFHDRLCVLSITSK